MQCSKSIIPFRNMKINTCIFYILCRNAHTEQVFSMMTSFFRNTGNNLLVNTVIAEFQICYFLEECPKMYKILGQQKTLLDGK